MERKLICPYCEKTFKFEKSLLDHMNSHTGETPYKCSECSNAYSYGIQLRDHMRTQHKLNDKKTISSKEVLEKLEQIHANDKPYRCGACDMLFSFENSLTHERVCNWEKPNLRKQYGIIEPEIKGIEKTINNNIDKTIVSEIQGVINNSEIDNLPEHRTEIKEKLKTEIQEKSVNSVLHTELVMGSNTNVTKEVIDSNYGEIHKLLEPEIEIKEGDADILKEMLRKR